MNLTWGTFVKNAVTPNTPKPVGIKTHAARQRQKKLAAKRVNQRPQKKRLKTAVTKAKKRNRPATKKNRTTKKTNSNEGQNYRAPYNQKKQFKKATTTKASQNSFDTPKLYIRGHQMDFLH